MNTFAQKLRDQTDNKLSVQIALAIEDIQAKMQRASNEGEYQLKIRVPDKFIAHIKLWCTNEGISCLGDTFVKMGNGVPESRKAEYHSTQLILSW